MPWPEEVAQHGPVGRHATTELSLYVRTFQAHMRERKLPVDVRSAFYSMLRHFLIGHDPQVGDDSMRGGGQLLGLDCSGVYFYTSINKGTNKRDTLTPFGDSSKPYVAQGILTLER